MYITVDEFLKNIEKNGLEQARGSLFKDERGTPVIHNKTFSKIVHRQNIYDRTIESPATIIAACALGQGLINSGLLMLKASSPNDMEAWSRIESRIVHLNDNMGMPIKDIVKEIRDVFPGKMNIKLRGTKFNYMPFIEEGAYNDGV